MRTVATQRAHLLKLERMLQKYGGLRHQLMQVQDDLIHGRVDKARVGISGVLLEWPMS